MQRPGFIAVCIIIVLNCYHAFSQVELKGTVFNRRSVPVQNAQVALSTLPLETKTDESGRFYIYSTGTKYRSGSATEGKVFYNRGIIMVQNISSKNVIISLFDLRGRKISLLHDGILKAGTHKFTIPQICLNQTIIVNVRLDSVNETFLVKGLFSGSKIAGFNSNVERTAEISDFPGEIKVTHDFYDEEIITVVDPNDSLVVYLYKKLSFNKENEIAIGDTLRCNDQSVSLSLDSINDHRCPCDVFCESPGEAFLYFTLTINGVSYPVELGAYENRDITLQNYKVALENIDSCVLESPEDYLIRVSISRKNSEYLFVDHFITENSIQLEGQCMGLCIDFPMYSYSNDTLVSFSGGYFLTDSTKMILGDGKRLAGLGSGIASGLTSVNSFPFTSRGMTINKKENDGTVHISYKGETIVLAPGQAWENDTVYIDTGDGCTRKVSVNENIYNAGFLNYSVRNGR